MSCFTLELVHLAALPHFLHGGGNGTLRGQLSPAVLNSSPGLYIGVVKVDGGVSLVEVDTNDGMLNDVTGAVFLAVTGAVTGEVTGGVTVEVMRDVAGGGTGAGAKTGSRVTTGTGTEARTGVGTGAVALEAWWRAARCRPRSFSTGPR